MCNMALSVPTFIVQDHDVGGYRIQKDSTDAPNTQETGERLILLVNVVVNDGDGEDGASYIPVKGQSLKCASVIGAS